MARYPNSTEMATKLMMQVNADVPGISSNPVLAAAVEAALTAWFAGGGHVLARKHERLTEKLKLAVEAGKFGPLLEADGTTPTKVGEIFKAFRDIYNEAFLAQFDEEGELLR